MKKVRIVLALMLACVLVLCACGQSDSPAASTGGASTPADASTPAGEPQGETVITLALPGGWDSLCPLASTANNSDTVCNTIFENLFEADGTGGWIGRLGESFEITDDNTAMVVNLRQGAVWHDGEPFDADDVMFSVGVFTNDSYTSSRRLFFQAMDGCTSSGVEESAGSAHVEKIDENTVKFYYKNAMSEAAMFNGVSAFFVLPEHLLSDADLPTILENDFWVNPIGTGPFTYESDVAGESLTVKAFDDYYLGCPKFDKLVVKVITPANLVTSMMANEVDVITGSLAAISDADFDLAQTIDGYTVQSLESTSSQFLVVNSDVFTTAKVRQALAMMMDKETMIQAGCGGRAQLMYTPYAAMNMWCDDDVIAELGYEYDPDTAYEMLVEEGFDFDRTYIVAINDLPLRQAMMTVMQETWAKYGMKLEIKTLDTQTCIAEMREGNVDFWINGGAAADITNLNIALIDWVTINADGTYAPFNLSRVKDPTLMEQYTALGAAIEEADLKAITSEIQKTYLTGYDYIYIICPNVNTAINDRVKGIDEAQMLALTLNYCDWEVVG